MSKEQFFNNQNGTRIAYNHILGNKPTIIFLSGFMSDKEGTKALALEEFSQQEGHGFVRFDYTGHGHSGGDFTEGNIDIWLADSLQVVDQISVGEVILVGSSMGGWLMLQIALQRPERVKALLGIASAPDFTEGLMWDDFSDEVKANLERGEVYNLPCDDEGFYPITMQLIESGRRNLLLDKDKIAINCPVRLIHGTEDKDVPFAVSEQIVEKLESDDVNLRFVEGGDHRMSSPEHIAIILEELGQVV
jgi:pimeloyl-ACP methyl ester carboxylesterase